MQPVGVVPQDARLGQVEGLEHQALAEQERTSHCSWGRTSDDAESLGSDPVRKHPPPTSGGGAEPSGGTPSSPLSEVTRSPGSVASSALQRGERLSPLEKLGKGKDDMEREASPVSKLLASAAPLDPAALKTPSPCLPTSPPVGARARTQNQGTIDARQIRSEPATPTGGRGVPTWDAPLVSPGSATGDTGGTPVSGSRGGRPSDTLLSDSLSASLVLTEEPSDDSPEEFRSSRSSSGLSTSLRTAHSHTSTQTLRAGEVHRSAEADTQTPSVVDMDIQTQTTGAGGLLTDASTQTDASTRANAAEPQNKDLERKFSELEENVELEEKVSELQKKKLEDDMKISELQNDTTVLRKLNRELRNYVELLQQKSGEQDTVIQRMEEEKALLLQRTEKGDGEVPSAHGLASGSDQSNVFAREGPVVSTMARRAQSNSDRSRGRERRAGGRPPLLPTTPRSVSPPPVVLPEAEDELQKTFRSLPLMVLHLDAPSQPEMEETNRVLC